jgi:hypothetical protein
MRVIVDGLDAGDFGCDLRVYGCSACGGSSAGDGEERGGTDDWGDGSDGANHPISLTRGEDVGKKEKPRRISAQQAWRPAPHLSDDVDRE